MSQGRRLCLWPAPVLDFATSSDSSQSSRCVMSATDRVRAVNIASLAVLVLSLLLLAWFLAPHSYRLQADDTVTSARMHFVYVNLSH